MRYRVILIEERGKSLDSGICSALSACDAICCERTTWQILDREQTRPSEAHLAIADLGSHAPEATGALRRLRAACLAVPTLALVPADASDELLRTAAEAVDDFILWPAPLPELRQRLARMIPSFASSGEGFSDLDGVQLVGNDPSFLGVVRQLPLMARSGSPILITGETGTGKELCARALHHLGPRRSGPFIAVDCGAVPEHLFENEFFGHVRGAFTDAHRDQRGLVAMAEGGTLFLDEIESLSLGSQAKLLRFLQERTFRQLGADHFSRADVNVVAASNRSLERCVRERQFRSDLYFRLNVLCLDLPPLRERRADIAPLALHALARLNRESRTDTPKSFSRAALRWLESVDWPGNVRELSNVVQRAFALSEGVLILPAHVSAPRDARAPRAAQDDFRTARSAALAAFERHYVEEALQRHRGNVTHAARAAGKERRAFGRLVKKYGIKRDAAPETSPSKS